MEKQQYQIVAKKIEDIRIRTAAKYNLKLKVDMMRLVENLEEFEKSDKKLFIVAKDLKISSSDLIVQLKKLSGYIPGIRVILQQFFSCSPETGDVLKIVELISTQFNNLSETISKFLGGYRKSLIKNLNDESNLRFEYASRFIPTKFSASLEEYGYSLTEILGLYDSIIISCSIIS
jgi:hypothetical protein